MGRTPTLLGQAGRTASSELARRRRAAKLTQAELTDRVNTATGHRLPLQAITEMENQRRRIDVDDLVALAQALSCTPHEMLGLAVDAYGQTDPTQREGLVSLTAKEGSTCR